MYSIIFETSERADNLNWVKGAILKSNLDLLAFEGYTVKNSIVSLLLDRGLFKTDCTKINSEELFSTLNGLPQFHLKAKVEFAQKLSCKYLFFCYSYINENCYLFELSSTEAKEVISFISYKDFANWTIQYRDLVMKSPYEESGLPKIDIELRKIGTPWPGNLDYVLLKEQMPAALIEFQRTSKSSVENHCNNTWFLPTSYRKGDVNRWLAIDIIRKQSKLPLFIIVWSVDEKVIKLKLVEKIVYPHDSDPKKGLRYDIKEVMDVEKMIKILKGN